MMEPMEAPFPRNDPETLKMATLFRILKRSDVNMDPTSEASHYFSNSHGSNFEEEIALFEKEWGQL